MVNVNSSSRTLSGIDERSVVSLSLPSAVAALSIGGDIGAPGEVVAKNEITNKLEWDKVDDISIPPKSIDGTKLTENISITTSGNITLHNDTSNDATLTADLIDCVGKLTAGAIDIDDGSLSFTGTDKAQSIIFGSSTGEILGNTTSETKCKNLDLSDSSNVMGDNIEHKKIIFTEELEALAGVGRTQSFKVDAATGDITKCGSISCTTIGASGAITTPTLNISTHSLNFTTTAEGGAAQSIVFGHSTGEILGNSNEVDGAVLNTKCKNLDLTDSSNVLGTDIEHGDIVFYVELVGKNGIAGAQTFKIDATTGNITQCGTITCGNISSTGTINGTAGTFTSLHSGPISSTGSINGTAGTFSSLTTSGNLTFTGTGEILGNTTSDTICKNLDLSDSSNILANDISHRDITFTRKLKGIDDQDPPVVSFEVDALTGEISGNNVYGNNTYHITPSDTDGSHHSYAVFDRIDIKGNGGDGDPTEYPSEIEGETIFRPQKHGSTASLSIRHYGGSDDVVFEARPNVQDQPSGTDNIGVITINGNTMFPATATSSPVSNEVGGIVGFGAGYLNTLSTVPMYIGNVSASDNSGGLVFNTPQPCIIGQTATPGKTKCFNLDISDSSNKTSAGTDDICITRFYPSTEYKFPQDKLSFTTWNDIDDDVYDFTNIHDEFYVLIPKDTAQSSHFENFAISWQVYVHEAIWGEFTSSTSGNSDLMYRYVYSTTSNTTPAVLGKSATYWKSGSGNSSISGGTSTNKLYGGGYNAEFTDVLEMPSGLDVDDNVKVWVQLRNEPYSSASSEPALVELRAGETTGNIHRADWILKAAPINQTNLRNYTT